MKQGELVLITEETGCEFSISLSHRKLKLKANRRHFKQEFCNLCWHRIQNLAESWDSGMTCWSSWIDSHHTLTTQVWPWLLRISLIYPQEFMTWVGPWQTTDSMEKQLLHGPPPPSPAPQTGICSFCATPPESTAAGTTRRPISSGWDSVRGEWERGRGIQNRPRHPWRLSEG